MRDRFFSLGFGGSVAVRFETPIRDRPGPDLRVFEISHGAAYPLEEANVYALVGGVAYPVGRLTNRVPVSGSQRTREALIDLSDATTPDGRPVRLFEADLFRIQDASDPARFRTRPEADGFDLDGIEALAPCGED